jgi:hypothetical protein
MNFFMNFFHYRERRPLVLLAPVLLSIAISIPAVAAEQGAPAKDPTRWYSADVTPQQQAATSRKEAQAAYQEALAACRAAARGERQACIKEAKDNLKTDLDAARSGSAK